MLEIRSYKRAELSVILGTNSKQGMLRKLDRWGVSYTEKGRGKNLEITITEIDSPFKVYCITELGFEAGCDFRKIRNLFYYFFNDDEFMAMPDEVKEYRLDKNSKHVARQSIAKYIAKLDAKNLIDRNTKEFIYYFAYRHNQRITDRDEYRSAWHDYWSYKDAGLSSSEARWNVICDYGGMPRKQPIPQINGIYLEEINYLCDLIQESFEKEIEANAQF